MYMPGICHSYEADGHIPGICQSYTQNINFLGDFRLLHDAITLYPNLLDVIKLHMKQQYSYVTPSQQYWGVCQCTTLTTSMLSGHCNAGCDAGVIINLISCSIVWAYFNLNWALLGCYCSIRPKYAWSQCDAAVHLKILSLSSHQSQSRDQEV